MILRRDELTAQPPDSADIAYLLLIFIIIVSLIGTDNIFGVTLPSSHSADRPDRLAIRIRVTQSAYIIGQTEYEDPSPLLAAVGVSDDSEVIIIADESCPMSRIKMLLSSVDKCGCRRIAFMTDIQ